MVLLHVKGETEEEEFLYECTAGSRIEDVLTAVVSIEILRSEVRHLSARLRELFFEGSPPETWEDPKISLYRLASEAESYASKEQVLRKRPLLLHILRDFAQSLKREITLSPLVESAGVNLSQLLSGFVTLDLEMTQLWWAGRELARGKRLCDYVGSNEKTKVTVILKSASSDIASPMPSCK